MSGVRSIAARLSVLTAPLALAVFGATPARADACDPAIDPACTPVIVTNFPPSDLGYVVSYIDDRQFTAVLYLLALIAAVTLADFVWRASGSLKLGGRR